jgi:signal transduction histidine kinase
MLAAADPEEESTNELARQRRFVIMVAHEMRNLVAPLIYGVEVLARADPESAIAVRSSVALQLTHLKRFIEDLLDVTCSEAGFMHLSISPVDLRAVVGAAIDVARPLLVARSQQLSIEDDPLAPAKLAGDHCRLTQVVANLLINAANYTPRGGNIQVSIERESPLFKVCVRDTGVGIASDVLPRIFDAGARNTQSQDKAPGGLGLGLTVARHLVELHGGTLRAQSAGPGKGSEFVMLLPAERTC